MTERQGELIEFSAQELENLEIFHSSMLYGPAEFFSVITPPECYSQTSAREFFIARCLSEVQKAAFALERWTSAVKDITARQAPKVIVALKLAAMVDEQSVWRRKLVEALGSLICFSTTNTQAYYLHYLLVGEYARALHEAAEQRDSFGSESATNAAEIQRLLSLIDNLERGGSIDPSQCWYLKDKRFVGALSARSGSRVIHVESSFRQRLLFAMDIAEHSERRALGYCYEIAFSEPSGGIHFSPFERLREPGFEQFRFGCHQVPLLALSVVARCQRLAGISPDGSGSILAREYAKLVDEGHPFAKLFAKGDFVVAIRYGFPCLAEVVDIAAGRAGIESYRVRYLDELPFGTIVDDWVRPDFLHLLMKFTELMNATRQTVAGALCEIGTESDANRAFVDVSPEVLAKSIRDAAITLWVNGLRDFYKKNIRKSGA